MHADPQSDIDDFRDPATLDDETVASVYFEEHPSEHLAADRVRIDPPAIDLTANEVEAGRYCVLTTAHVSTATANSLDEWCSSATTDRPIAVASTIYGWFVPAREVDEPTLARLPADLLAAMKFARERGFDHILFDCDANGVEDLPQHNW